RIIASLVVLNFHDGLMFRYEFVTRGQWNGSAQTDDRRGRLVIKKPLDDQIVYIGQGGRRGVGVQAAFYKGYSQQGQQGYACLYSYTRIAGGCEIPASCPNPCAVNNYHG